MTHVLIPDRLGSFDAFHTKSLQKSEIQWQQYAARQRIIYHYPSKGRSRWELAHRLNIGGKQMLTHLLVLLVIVLILSRKVKIRVETEIQ